MSTLNVSTIIPDVGTDTDLDLSGKGTGRPDLQAGFKVGGTAGIPTASIRDSAVTLAKLDTSTLGGSGKGYSECNDKREHSYNTGQCECIIVN